MNMKIQDLNYHIGKLRRRYDQLELQRMKDQERVKTVIATKEVTWEGNSDSDSKDKKMDVMPSEHDDLCTMPKFGMNQDVGDSDEDSCSEGSDGGDGESIVRHEAKTSNLSDAAFDFEDDITAYDVPVDFAKIIRVTIFFISNISVNLMFVCLYICVLVGCR